jgi:DNA-binding CsgD family transcriptional regulator
MTQILQDRDTQKKHHLSFGVGGSVCGRDRESGSPAVPGGPSLSRTAHRKRFEGEPSRLPLPAGDLGGDQSAPTGLGQQMPSDTLAQVEDLVSHRADQELLAAFSKARRRFRGAIVAINDRTFLINPSAAELLQPADHRTLRQLLKGDRPAHLTRIALANGVSVHPRCLPVGPPQEPIGIVLHLSLGPAPTSTPTASPPLSAELATTADPLAPGAVDPALLTGWSELTDTERAIAELVGQGLSNKQAGRRLFLSPHTIDYHLRRVYRKLGITSRVELARLLGEHYDSLARTPPRPKTA